MSLPDLQVLKETIPARARRAIYTAWVALVVIDGAVAAAYAAIPATLPPALVVAAAVLLYLGIPVGTLAAVNVPSTLPPAGPGGGTTVILSSDPATIATVSGKAGPVAFVVQLARRVLAFVVGVVISLVLPIVYLDRRSTWRAATGRPIRA